ncbi:MAG: polyprenyl synthetase family protein, partial [Propionibacteriaceae bacterium]|nr:polyprenyl synthetase family protein [Propionibacteriaceae bacterium]
MQPLSPSDPLDSSFRSAVAAEISGFLDDQAERYSGVGEMVPGLFRLAAEFTSGGKRIRPAFCYWSYVAATGEEPRPEVLRAAASLDLLHVSALMHDDVMDASNTRRGVPAAHVQYETLHQRLGGSGSAAAFGRAGA